MKTKPTKLPRKKYDLRTSLFLIIITLIIGAGGYVYVERHSKPHTTSSTQQTIQEQKNSTEETPVVTPTINLSPATSVDNQDSTLKKRNRSPFHNSNSY